MLYGNIQYCQYGNDDPISYPHFFNACAVYKFISRMVNMLTIIRNEKLDFFIKFKKPEEENIEDIMAAYIVQKKEIDQSSKGKYVNDKFLKSRAILKGTALEKSIAKKYFQKDSLKEVLKPFCNIKGFKRKLESFCDRTNKHNTYYCFVRYDNGKLS